MTRWDATEYSKHSSEQQKWARELIGKLNLRPHERVLDIGCGDGKVTAEIAMAVPRGSVVGIDVSEEMIAFAKCEHGSGEAGNLRFEPGDASKLRYCDAFDVVFSNAVLHWIVDHRPVLNGIARALVPGGRALLQMGGAGNAADVVAVMGRVIESFRWRGYFDGFAFKYGFHAPPEYRQWMLDAGLTPVRVELIPKDMLHRGRQGLDGWIRTTWMPYTHRVPDAKREQFIDDVASAYLVDHPADSEGNVHLKMVRLEVEAARS